MELSKEENSKQIEVVIKDLHGGLKSLPHMALPSEVQKGSIDLDRELHKLAEAIKILPKLIYTGGTETARLKQRYYSEKYKLMKNLSKDDLDKMAIVKSNKPEFIKASLHQEMHDWDIMKVKTKFLEDTIESYKEMTMTYKKTRYAFDEQGNDK